MDNNIRAKLNDEEMDKVTGGVGVNGEDLGDFDIFGEEKKEDDGSVNVEPIIRPIDTFNSYKITKGPKKPW